MTRRAAGRWVVLLLVAAIGGAVAWAVWPRSAATPNWADEYDLDASQPELIAPGTVIGRTAPAGWSHLIIKAVPRVRPSEVANVPGLGRDYTVRMASWLVTGFVANVTTETQAGATRFRLGSIALGLGTSIDGREVIVTPETAGKHGVDLDLITREILTKGYETQSRARIVIHGPAFALVDTPVWYRCDGKNRLVRFRYALVLGAADGGLKVIAWLLDSEGSCGDGSAVILAPNTIDEAELVPDPNEFNKVGIPSDAAFAVDRLPPHTARLVLPPDLRPLAMQVKYTSAEAASLETGLRRLLATH